MADSNLARLGRLRDFHAKSARRLVRVACPRKMSAQLRFSHISAHLVWISRSGWVRSPSFITFTTLAFRYLLCLCSFSPSQSRWVALSPLGAW